MCNRTIQIDPIEELLVAWGMIRAPHLFRTMDNLREWAHRTARLIREYEDD